MTSGLTGHRRTVHPALAEFKKYVKYWDLCLMLAPVIAYFIIFKYIPMGGIVIAFKDYKLGLGISGSMWVGFENFIQAFQTRFFIRSIRNTLIISLYKLAVGFPSPIILALLLNEVRHSAYKRVVQTISYLPHFLSWVIMAGILTQLLSPNNGAVNALLKNWFGRRESISFLLDNRYFRGTAVVSDVWKGVGWGSILYLATISSIDPTLYEAAICDGASRPQRVRYSEGRIAYNGALYDELLFDSITRSTRFAEPSFILHDVVIGIDFHWQQKRTLKFAGGLKFIVEGDKVRAVNLVGMEDYLLSVISSEMKSSASVDLLKAHAVISRSWLLARMRDRLAASRPDRDSDYPAIPLEGAQGVKIPKVEIPHRDFDVCADDHCQRYQGLTMAVGDNVRTVIDETWGQVLRYKGQLCDTRYAKCCGGKTELFSTCWEDVDYPYLQCVDDPWCDCENDEILAQVLNDYDQQTKDFHDWTVRYGADELAALVRERTGIDFGEIRALEPIERGPSGRIKYLRIVGSKRTETVGKELKIRRALSSSHLKSSAFEVERDPAGAWILRGRGWGHGVGLCQIGAAVMAARGHDYREILQHYYPGTDVE